MSAQPPPQPKPPLSPDPGPPLGPLPAPAPVEQPGAL